jgi:prepilin-type N-terminal cleavage/methylation domain-containing protein
MQSWLDDKGYTLIELLISLAVILLLTVSMLSFGGAKNLKEEAFNSECQKVLYSLLEYQNEAIMDGYRRQVRFLNTGMLISWTKNSVHHQVLIPVETLTFSGAFTGADALNLYGHGTVSRGGTITLNGSQGLSKKIVVQIGNGRIYLDEP